MITKFHSYPKMKNSGVEWLGEVPEHWDSVATKRYYLIQLGKMLQSRAIESTDIEIPYLKAQHVQWFSVRTADAPKMWASPNDIEQFGIRAGDLLVCEGGEGGRCGLIKDVESGYIIQNALHRVRASNNCMNEYLQYLMSVIATTGWFDAINNKATIAHFTKEKFGSLRIPLPPHPEQTAIVRYLDYFDRRIQRYVRAKQRLIKLLEEQKKAVIHRAVTRGLDPDVSLKPSGVEWLGDVPKHWEVMRLKYLLREQDTRSMTGSEQLLRVSQYTGVTKRKNEKGTNLPDTRATSLVNYKCVSPNELVINIMLAWNGSMGVSDYSGITSPAYCVYKFLNRAVPRYFHNLLRSPNYKARIKAVSTGIVESRLRLYTDDLYRLEGLLPPHLEQTAIVEYLDKVTADIDAKITRARRQADLMHEYRTRLIADVVTGKLDVREAAAELPDESDEPEACDNPENMIDNGGALDDAAGGIQ